MPTGRAYGFLIAAVLLYLFANQTQIGWLYVMAALLAGVLLAAWLLNRRALRGIRGSRTLNGQPYAEVDEGQTVDVCLRLNHVRTAAVQFSLVETCPLAAPDSEQREQRLFIPVLPAGDGLPFNYQVEADRRGVYAFAPLALRSRAPFGLFSKHGQLTVETRALVLPEVRSLKSFRLLDRQLAAQVVYPRSGVGSEVIGVRPYRPGDSQRHIHWRSVARTGQLISREFAEETRPGLTLVLDRHYPADFRSKHNPFEWAVKCAVSIGDYARQRGYPVYLLAETSDLPTPGGAVAWDSLLQYMARVTPQPQPSLAEVLSAGHLQSFVAVIIAWPDMAAVDALLMLRHRGYHVLPVLLNPASFPGLEHHTETLSAALHATGIDTAVVDYGTDWAAQLV
ncbi:MAG: DUF58 domain-containing protein [Anaerolineae bacterium]